MMSDEVERGRDIDLEYTWENGIDNFWEHLKDIEVVL
jgi:hypothetical protein